jgi:hypothetical protein
MRVDDSWELVSNLISKLIAYEAPAAEADSNVINKKALKLRLTQGLLCKCLSFTKLIET